MFAALRVLIKNQQLLRETVKLALRARFVGNALGAGWLVLYPLIFLSLYATVFIHILGVRFPSLSPQDYVLVIFSGLVPFLAFSESFGVGTGSIVSNRALLKNTLFPIELVVVRDVIVGHASMGLGMLLVWGSALYHHHIYWTHALLPFIYLLQIMMVLGIVWLTSTLSVFFRDLLQTTPILVLLLMMVSPIAYTEDMVPEGLTMITAYNPLAWLMELYRACLLEGRIPLDTLALLTVFSVVLFSFGYRVIVRLKPIFADYV